MPISVLPARLRAAALPLALVALSCGTTNAAQPPDTGSPTAAERPTTAPTSRGIVQRVHVSVTDDGFASPTIVVPGDAPVALELRNLGSEAHSWSAYATERATNAIFAGDAVAPDETAVYRFTSPARPGTYVFRCDLHPGDLTGTLVVG